MVERNHGMQNFPSSCSFFSENRKKNLVGKQQLKYADVGGHRLGLQSKI